MRGGPVVRNRFGSASPQQLPREVLDLDHFGDEKQVDDGADQEDAACEQPNQAGNPPAEVKTVKSQNAKPAKEPEKIRNKIVFHSNTLGSGALGFQLQTTCMELKDQRVELSAEG